MQIWTFIQTDLVQSDPDGFILDSHSLAIANAMPDFHSSMKERLRTPEQGADTVVWLAVSEAAVKNPSGRFFQGEQTHTHTSAHTRAVLQT